MADREQQDWLIIQFELAGSELPQVESLLEAQGVLSISLKDAEDQPILEPLPDETPLWSRVVVNALFPSDADPALIRTFLLEKTDTELLGWGFRGLEDRVWERVWMDDFKPMQFGEKLWIVPSWSEPPEPEAVNLMLDPGLAFGTGTHPTTRLCLEWLDEHPPQGLEVIDYGCGSGILAIAALKLGAVKAYGVDIDPQALISSNENALRNGVPSEQLVLTEAKSLHAVDVLLANILSGPLVNLAPEFSRLVKPGGRLVLSGILDDQAEDVMTACAPCFDDLQVVSLTGWCSITGQRKCENQGLGGQNVR